MESRSALRRWTGRILLVTVSGAVFLLFGLFYGSRNAEEVCRMADSVWDRVQPWIPGTVEDHDHDHEHEGHDDDANGEKGHDHASEADHDDDHDDDHAAQAGKEEKDEHEGHQHAAKPRYDHPHDEEAALKLSEQARANIGLRLAPVKLQTFQRTITVPGMIVERPGWSTVEVTAPMTGVVTRIFPLQGEAVMPGQKLFEVRLTHEDLLQKQTEFLRGVEELEVVGREVARLEKIAADGAVAGKTFLERKYEQQKQEAALRAQRQALLLHGLTQEQIDRIEKDRTLLQSLTVTAPKHEDVQAGDRRAAHDTLFQVQELKVSQGTYVTAGSVLCQLVDPSELYIEGKAFEQDVAAINRAAAEGWTVRVALGADAGQPAETVEGLKILYLDDKVEADSRAFHFYVALANRVVREDAPPGGRRFVYWQYKPGQRMQILVPVESWPDRIVLPGEAVAQDGAETYVFEANGDHFDRRAVHVEYRDQNWVVIANDGAIRPGAMVAQSAAHQMQLALKNKAGAGVDPHAGHNH